ncbi:MAG TPA: biosynthetic-type acetolactate synthase large subunit [Bacteroidales bacterium]|nr:biosynthetic-type acetolactate synthase large subunit [Bacteroidales bacterium]
MKTEENNENKVNGNDQITGAEALLKCLLEEGVDTIFGYPGGAIMPVYDKLLDFEDKLKHYLTRHEQGAAHAAQAYAMVTGKPGVCFATSGPGATNLVTGIANAYLDSVPVVFITAQVVSGLIGTDAFQETDIIGVSMPVTKWNCQVKKACEISETIAKAFYIAKSGRPGPVLVDITKDAQLEKLFFTYEKCNYIRSYNPRRNINMKAIESAAIMINHAERPLILAGHGVLIAGAEKELKAFAEKTGIPVALTLLGLSAFPCDHRLYTGMLGMHGNYGPNILTNEADLIIAVGMRFDDRVTGNTKKYADKASIIHIEIDEAEINKNIKVDVEIHCDAKDALGRLLPLVKENSYEKWIREFRILDKKEKDNVIKNDTAPESGEIKMGEVVKLISDLTAGDAVIVTDVGQNQMIAARYFQYKHPNSFVTSGGMGTMGFGIPAGIGAKIGCPDKQVVTFVGDGGFQMTVQELGTILQYKIPVKLIILNNNYLGMVRQWQDMFFDKRYASTELVNPDFVKIAAAYSIPAQKIDERKDLKAGLKEMLDSKGPYLLEITVEKEGNVFPMVEPGSSVSEVRLTY